MAGKAFMRAYSAPEGEALQEDFAKRQAMYNLLQQYYTNEAFDSLIKWSEYKGKNRLYRAHRGIYNPTKRLVNFYAAKVYPGYVKANPDPKESVMLAYPLPDDTPQELRNALGQLWQWTNWQLGKSVLVRQTAMVGDRLVEIVDNPAKGKVYFEQVWPGHVKEMILDEMGNVKGYTLEYQTLGEDKKPYKYTKVVTKDSIQEHHDDRLVNTIPLEYGFVPACWFRHTDEGSTWGAAALRSIGKVDELNDLVSQAHDNLRKQMGAPTIISSEAQLKKLGEVTKRPTDDVELDRYEAEMLNVWTTIKPATISSIDLDPAAALEWATRLVQEIEADHPEVTFYDQLREMQNVSGVAVSQLMGDVDGYLIDAQASYDQQCIKLFQMSIAIAGWRVNNGDWQTFGQTLTKQQEMFSPYSLESFAAGALDFEILPRPLFREGRKEELEIESAELDLERKQVMIANERRALAAPIDTPDSVANRLRGA